jgi:hypothetical protein
VFKKIVKYFITKNQSKMQQVSTAKGAATRMSKGLLKKNSQKFWLPMESSPEVMTKFLHLTGVPDDFEVRDLPTLEEGDEALAAAVGDPGNVLAVIFLLPKDLEIIVRIDILTFILNYECFQPGCRIRCILGM